MTVSKNSQLSDAARDHEDAARHRQASELESVEERHLVGSRKALEEMCGGP